MFQSIQPAPPDPILGLTEAFNQDTRSDKVNLSVGVYKNDQGITPVLECVASAEQRLLGHESSKSYLPITGLPTLGHDIRAMILGDDDPRVSDGSAVTCQCPGGTGALRVAGDYLKQKQGVRTIRVSDPTWANHRGIFTAAGLEVETYRYFDASTHGLDITGMLESLAAIPDGDAVLLHACCHNPTGVDPSAEQWQQIADALAGRDVLPILDFAYQGFGDGLDSDAQGIRRLASTLPQMMICSSYSKNFSLYNERVGALTVLADDPTQAAAVLSQIKLAIRTNYSNPPAHGALIVQTILQDHSLSETWKRELTEMRNRINAIRTMFRDKLDERGIELTAQGNGFISEQRGMFSFSGLSRDEVDKLRDDHAIYIVGSGRVNVAGLTGENLNRVCDAIATVKGL